MLKEIHVHVYTGKLKFSLFLEDIWGSGDIAPPFLTPTLDGGGWSASGPGRFIHGETASGTNWIGGWMGSGTGLEAFEKRKIFPLPGMKHRQSSP
jgi:hypothetical protein